MFERLELLISKNKLLELKTKTVLVIGLGGVGGYVVESLARSGIGKLILVDYDTIDETNINRQIIALHSTIGKQKTEIFKQRVMDINPAVDVVVYDMFYNNDNKDEIFQEPISFVVDAIDSVASKKLIIQECLIRHIPFISCMGMGNRFDPTKIQIDDLCKTSYDPLAKIFRKWIKDSHINDKIFVCWSSEIPLTTQSTTIGSNAFVPPSAGLLIGSFVIKELIKEK